MAGAGIRLFVSGETLTATLVNQYLMDQVVARFATVTDRNNAFGGDGQPTLSVGDEGRICYIDATNELQYWDGSTWLSFTDNAIVGIIEAKGDIIAGTAANTVDILAAGTNGYVLSANSTTGTGLEWVVQSVADGTITNAKVNASAAIALSKLATGAAATIVLHNSAGVPTATAVSGDVTITNAGVVEIAAGKIVNADINASAAIDLGKLADVAIDTKTADYVLVLTDKNKIIEMDITTTANTVTVPLNATAAFPVGSQITIWQYGTGKTRIIPVSGTVTINKTPGDYLRARYSSATLIKRATNEWQLLGDLSES